MDDYEDKRVRRLRGKTMAHVDGGKMSKGVTILKDEPTIEVVAEMRLDQAGVIGMTKWVEAHRPECLPADFGDHLAPHRKVDLLFPHEGCRGNPPRADELLTDNELLVEMAGRKCYDSFGAKAGRKSNAEYIAHTQEMDPPHASILYHAKMSFFIAGLSRRVSHEFIRNYVGADRNEEGSPSQESTRFTHHYGYFIAPPRYLEADGAADGVGGTHTRLDRFTDSMKRAYDDYLSMVAFEMEFYEQSHGEPPKGEARKRIYEAASALLPHQAETSFIWTTNPAALAKFFKERCPAAADLEMQRFAKKWKRICVERWPNIFPQPWMKVEPFDPDWAAKRAAAGTGA